MRITPLHSNEPTFLRLTKFEWVVAILGGVLIPLFIQSLLRFLGIHTHLPIAVASTGALVFVLFLYFGKNKEQDFLITILSNRTIPDSLEGIYTDVMPVMKEGGFEKDSAHS